MSVTSSVVTLANSIIGVSILAMPFCYKQCGVILATIMVILSGTLVKVACHLLLKSALLARRRNFEHLAFHTYGVTGKLLVELGIIGYLAGTAIAFFVVMGDLGPPMVAKVANIEYSANLRMVILTGLALFVALPLSLLRNIESLQYICTASIGFYLCVVIRVVLQALPHLMSSEWLSVVNLWRPGGMLQCFPIFSLALSCQTNLFEVYASLPDATPAKMNEVVKGAVNLCSAIYITIGFFGYVAFAAIDFSGNILTSFPESSVIDVMKMGFVISVAVSFPLVMFPCRTSLHSLLFRKTYQGLGSTELVSDYIPPNRFNMLTACMIIICLIIGILVPDIELVLGLVGSTMGSCICVIFPGLMFIKLTNKDTTERLAAKAVVVVGLCTLVLGTYVNLMETSSASKDVDLGPVGSPIIDNLPDSIKAIEKQPIVAKVNPVIPDAVKNLTGKEAKVAPEAKRREPVIPQEPDSGPINEINKGQEPVIPQEPDSDSKNENKEKDKAINVNKIDKINEADPDNSRSKKDSPDDNDKKADKLIVELEKQKVESAKIIEEQKKILVELKEHQKQDKQAEEIAAIVNSVKEDVNNNQGIIDQKGANQQAVENYKGLDNQLVDDNQLPIENPVENRMLNVNDPSLNVLNKPVLNDPSLSNNNPDGAQQPLDKEPLINGQPAVYHPPAHSNSLQSNPNQPQQVEINQNPNKLPVMSPNKQSMVNEQSEGVNPGNPAPPVLVPNLELPKQDQHYQAGQPVVRQHLENAVNAMAEHIVDKNNNSPLETDTGVKSGRDLKENRIKREAERDLLGEVINKAVNGRRIEVKDSFVDPNCLNDPFCDEKFSRDPAVDSLVDRDLVKYLQVAPAGRSLLKKDEASSNLTIDRRNQSL